MPKPSKRAATSPKENIAKKALDTSPILAKIPAKKTVAMPNHETSLDALVKIELVSINGKPFYGQVSDEELLYIWLEVFKRRKDELFGITSSKTLTRNIRAIYKLNSPVKLQDIYSSETFRYEKFLDGGESEEIVGKILGYDALKPAQLGELTKVTVKTNFGVEPSGVLAWLSLYGTVTSHHDFKTNPSSGLKTDIFEAEIILKKHIEEYLPMFGQKTLVHYPGIERMCNRCYTSGHLRRDCNNVKRDWIVYVIGLVEDGGIKDELIGTWSKAVARWKKANANVRTR
jgi:hypothetical protein